VERHNFQYNHVCRHSLKIKLNKRMALTKKITNIIFCF
jgi:hypothetical protein